MTELSPALQDALNKKREQLVRDTAKWNAEHEKKNVFRLFLGYFGMNDICRIKEQTSEGIITEEQAFEQLASLSVENIMYTDSLIRSRPQKGRSILRSISNYVVIDLETTGLDPVQDEIIEIAAIRVRDSEKVAQYHTLVNPHYGIPFYVTELTGISDEMVKDAPSLSDVLPSFCQFVGQDILIGHNVNFDVNFLYTAFMHVLEKPFTNDFIDTMRLSRRLFKEERHHRLVDLISRFGIAEVEQHRALSDAQMTKACYIYMQKYATEHDIDMKTLVYHYRKKWKATYSVHAKDIVRDENIIIDETSPFYEKVFVFTGVLEKMPRRQAMTHVVNRGGICGDSVTKATNYLVLGNNDYCSTIKDGKSSKQKKAETLKAKGQDIEILSENVFYEMLLDD